ncbi:hypothetical protein ABK040_014808 [Willaertia magna]
MEHFLTVDILSIIAEYLDNAKDYFHLFQINKFVYNNVLNNNETILTNEIFKKDVIIYLDEKFPNYFFQLQNLNTQIYEKDNFNLIEKFKYLKFLEVRNLPQNFIIPNLPLLKELIIIKSNLQENTLINLQKHLRILDLQWCTLKDNCLNYLIHLQEFKTYKCHRWTDECLQKLINLEYLSIRLEDIYEEDFKNLTKLKTLDIEGNVLSENCFTNLINLKELNVSKCTNFTGKCLLNLTNLQKLYLFSSNIKDEYFKNLKNLKEINFESCNEILGECLFFLNNLEELSISYNDNLKDEYFKNLNNLKVFKAEYCNSLNGDFL